MKIIKIQKKKTRSKQQKLQMAAAIADNRHNNDSEIIKQKFKGI